MSRSLACSLPALLLAACSGSSAPAAPVFEMSCGTYAPGQGTATGSTFLFALKDASGAAPATMTSIQVGATPAPPGFPMRVICPAGWTTCLVRAPEIPAAIGATLTASATIGGHPVTTACGPARSALLPPAMRFFLSGNGSVTGGWVPPAGARSYYVRLVDAATASSGAPTVLADGVTRADGFGATPTPLPAAGIAGVAAIVEAHAIDLTGPVSSPLPVPDVAVTTSGAPAPAVSERRAFGPLDWQGGILPVPIPAGRSAAILILNAGAGATDRALATVAVSGAAPLASVAPVQRTAAAQLAPADAPLDAVLRGRELLRLAQAAELPAMLDAAPALGSGIPAHAALLVAPGTTSFCVRSGITGPFSRRTASLGRETLHGLFYVDAADAGDFAPADWDALAQAFEDRVYASDTSLFGPPSDVDGNGKVTILFSSRLGAASTTGILAGYFSPRDAVWPLDTSTGCTGTASNAADLFVMNTPSNLETAHFTRTRALGEVIPATLAHELQHLISFNLHCVLLGAACSDATVQETWLDEGMSMVAEDEAGFGWHDSTFAAGQYLRRVPADGLMGYALASLTVWEGDPVGNYQGVHAFLRYLVDRYGPGLLPTLEGPPVAGSAPVVGRADLEAALATTFDAAVGDFATAVAFSNEGIGPGAVFNYGGTDWTPFHPRLAYLDSTPLDPGTPATATLRKDGWNAFVTGPAGAAGATVTVTSDAAVKPSVVVVSYTGALPTIP